MEQVKINDVCKLCEKYNVKPEGVITFGNGDDTLKIKCKPRLSFAERSEMINEIAKLPFTTDEDSGNTVYAPYIKRFAAGYFIVKYFTELDVYNEDIENIWRLIEDTDITHKIADVVGEEYLTGILHDADELVEYKKTELLKTTKLDELLTQIIGVAKAIKDKTDNLDMTEVLNKLEETSPEWKDEITKILAEHKAATQE